MKKIYLAVSGLLAVLVFIASINGLIIQNIYANETPNWIAQCMAQDWINIVLTVPILLISSILAYKKSIAGFLIWLGALAFNIYSYLIYTFMVHFNNMFLLYSAILGVSIYLFIFALISADYEKIKKSFKDNFSRKYAYRLLMTIGGLFYLVWLKDIFTSLATGVLPKSIVEAGLFKNGVYVIDLALCLPALILAGYYLKKQKTAGYTLAGMALTFSAMMMANIAFIIYFVGQKGLPTDMSIAYVFGILAVLTTLLNAKFLTSFGKR